MGEKEGSGRKGKRWKRKEGKGKEIRGARLPVPPYFVKGPRVPNDATAHH